MSRKMQTPIVKYEIPNNSECIEQLYKIFSEMHITAIRSLLYSVKPSQEQIDEVIRCINDDMEGSR